MTGRRSRVEPTEDWEQPALQRRWPEGLQKAQFAYHEAWGSFSVYQSYELRMETVRKVS